ncbi:hypothetical protein EUGRSUZ_F03710 [Eucalyptus grandis]|uniref:Uncharacterized protein n=2 Tax=Eucalyptus grandis TaxID=71139 RepID=A0ACC3KPM6_EUCGR|nr:hypothetical protein EUGRSUZ_F03710 [Eucalyptus grandis]
MNLKSGGGQTHHFNAMTKCYKNCTFRLISPQNFNRSALISLKCLTKGSTIDQHHNAMTWICSNNLRPIISFIPQELKVPT